MKPPIYRTLARHHPFEARGLCGTQCTADQRGQAHASPWGRKSFGALHSGTFGKYEASNANKTSKRSCFTHRGKTEAPKTYCLQPLTPLWKTRRTILVEILSRQGEDSFTTHSAPRLRSPRSTCPAQSGRFGGFKGKGNALPPVQDSAEGSPQVVVGSSIGCCLADSQNNPNKNLRRAP